jgi:phage shock protein PspC (stress-responsive transcriptional regulator)
MVGMTDEQPPRDEAADDAVPGGATRAAPGEEAAPGGGRARPAISRGTSRKVLAGVCEGAGRYFGVDPVIFRIVLVVLALTGGIGLIVYGMGWLVIPQEGEEQSEAHRLMSGRIEGAPLTAVLMALVGCGLYASMIGNASNQAFSLILLFATAGAVYWSQRRRSAVEPVSPAAAAAAVDAPPAVAPPPEPGGPSWWRVPLTKEAPAYLWGPDDGPYGPEDRQAWRARKRAARAETRNWPFSLAVAVLALTALGAGTGASWPYQPAAAAVEIGLAAMLAVFGVAYCLASFAGAAKGGTTFFAVLTLAALVGTAALPKTGGHGLGPTTWRPLTAAGVHQTYERGAGRGLLDLTRLPLPAGSTVATRLKVGAGQAEVRVPAGATVVLDYDLGVGELVLPGKVNDGVDVKAGQHRTVTLRPAAGSPAAGTIDLDVEVGVGQLKVVR